MHHNIINTRHFFMSTQPSDPSAPVSPSDESDNSTAMNSVETSPSEPEQLALFQDTPATEEKAPVKKTTKKVSKKTTKKAAPKKEEKGAPKGEEAQEKSEKVSKKTTAKNKPATEEADAPSDKEKDEGEEQKDSSGKKPYKKPKKKEIILTGDPVAVDGLLELAPKGYGFLRRPEKGYTQARDDVFVPPEYVKKNGLRHCQWVHGMARQGPKGFQLTELLKVNDQPVADRAEAPVFEDLKAVNPDKRISLESTNECYNTRVIDLVSPIGRGQRGLIVAPPRSGKTTLLMDIAKSLMDRHEETIHPIFLLIDERPEEVTEFKRSLPEIEMFSSSNDAGNRNHTRVAEMCVERAKRLVEEGKHVFILMDSITRLARAYNRGADSGGGKKKGRGKGRNQGYQSGGIVSGALEVPRRLFAAARNTREAGSLTILATALVQTNSKADEAIFQEFKGTGNMEVVLDRRLADHYIYPAVDIFKSGTRREELLLPEITLKKFHMIRRGLKGHKPDQAMERLLYFLKKFPNNAQMLLEIKG